MFFLSASVSAAANNVEIASVAYLKETAKELSFEAAAAAFDANKFTANESSVINFGIASQPVWVRLEVSNTANTDELRLLIIRNPWIDELEVYYQDSRSQRVKQLAGDRFPYGERTGDLRYFAFPHYYAPGSTAVYIRAKTPDPLLLPMLLLDPNELRATEVEQHYSYGLVYGFILALALYNAILFISLRHRRYLYYAIYLCLFIAANIAYTGHGFKWLWPQAVVWQQWANPVLMLLYGFAGLLFATSFLQTAKNFPKVHRAVGRFCLFFALLGFVAIILNSQAAILYVAFSFIVLFSGLMVFLGVTAVRAGQKSAKYFMYGSMAAMTGASLTALTVWGAVPFSELGYRAVEIGMLIDSVLLAMALGDHFRLSQEERIKAERLAKIDPLTSLNNRRGFYEATKPLWINALRYKRDVSLILMDIDWFKQVNDTYGHMQGDKVLVAIADFLRHSAREGDVLARWGGEEFILFLPEASLSQACIFAERLRTSIEGLGITLNKTTVHVTASFGVTCQQGTTMTFDGIISTADKYLYQAKAEGRNRVGSEMPGQ